MTTCTRRRPQSGAGKTSSTNRSFDAVANIAICERQVERSLHLPTELQCFPLVLDGQKTSCRTCLRTELQRSLDL